MKWGFVCKDCKADLDRAALRCPICAIEHQFIQAQERYIKKKKANGFCKDCKAPVAKYNLYCPKCGEIRKRKAKKKSYERCK